MPFNDDIPADGTQGWGTPLRAAWASLRNFVNTLEAALAGKASTTDLTSGLAGKVNTSTYTAGLAGKADLVGGVIPTSQIPPIAINETFTAASQAAMLALTAQRGDVAVRSDVSRMFILTSDSPGTLADWKEIVAAGSVTSVAGRTGVVALTKADVGLPNADNTSDANKPVSTAQQNALNAKVNVADVAGLNDAGWGRAIFIPKGGTVPGGTPEHTIVIELDA